MGIGQKESKKIGQGEDQDKRIIGRKGILRRGIIKRGKKDPPCPGGGGGGGWNICHL